MCSVNKPFELASTLITRENDVSFLIYYELYVNTMFLNILKVTTKN